MRKIFFYIVSTIFFSQTLISQQTDYINGGVFSKRIEYNLLYWDPLYNLDSKRDYEKLFWGNFNAPVEFFFEPSFSGSYGFRMVRDTLKNPMLDAEVIRVIQSMPDWIPGKNKGKTVPVYMNLPVRF